jgi:hypothetical protein
MARGDEGCVGMEKRMFSIRGKRGFLEQSFGYLVGEVTEENCEDF